MASEKPIANPVVVLREEFDDWAILFNPDTADAVGINPVGVFVWKLLDGSRTLKEIVAEVDGHFSEVPAAADQEVRVFIKELVVQGFVGHEVEGPRP